jgi:hypothetical protein
VTPLRQDGNRQTSRREQKVDLQQLLFGVFSGDMGALTLLFAMLLPFVLVYAWIKWMIEKIRGS